MISFKIDYLKFLVSKDRFRIFNLIKSGNNVFKTGDFYFGDFLFGHIIELAGYLISCLFFFEVVLFLEYLNLLSLTI